MKTVWVLVADEAMSRILLLNTKDKALEPVEEIADPDAHASNAELRRDAFGRRNPGAKQGVSPSTVTASAGEEQSQQHAEVFAAKVASTLQRGLDHQRFNELIVVAPPHFLGLLRKAFDKTLQAAVVRDEPKDFVHFTNDDIYQRLFA